MFKATKRALAAIAPLAAALALAAPAAATPPLQLAANATNAGAPSSGLPCTPFCLQAVGDALHPAAQHRYNSPSTGHGGHAAAAELGFDRQPSGRAPAAELGFNRHPTGQPPAAELGFNRSTAGHAPTNIANHPNSRFVADTSAGSRASSSTSAPGTFHWGDAGIGAGSAFALIVLLLSGTVTATKLRRRRSSVQPTT
jgi:hypothetical protein